MCTCACRVDAAAGGPHPGVLLQAVDQQHDGRRVEVGVSVQGQDVRVLPLRLEQQRTNTHTHKHTLQKARWERTLQGACERAP